MEEESFLLLFWRFLVRTYEMFIKMDLNLDVNFNIISPVYSLFVKTKKESIKQGFSFWNLAKWLEKRSYSIIQLSLSFLQALLFRNTKALKRQKVRNLEHLPGDFFVSKSSERFFLNLSRSGRFLSLLCCFRLSLLTTVLVVRRGLKTEQNWLLGQPFLRTDCLADRTAEEGCVGITAINPSNKHIW